MPYEFTVRQRVEFAETDMAGIMHFANFFRWMERTEHAFLRSLGGSVHMVVDGQAVGWPRVHVECDYRQPLRFEDEVDVHLTVREKREKALVYDFVFRKGDGEHAVEVARGSFTTVSVSWDENSGRMKSVPIPEFLERQIEVAPASRERSREDQNR